MANDLFEAIETLPEDVQAVLEEFSSCDETYENCEALLKALHLHGYTFEYGLDAVPYDLALIEDEEG